MSNKNRSNKITYVNSERCARNKKWKEWYKRTTNKYLM